MSAPWMLTDFNTVIAGPNNNTSGLETDWLVCCICQRVLSTALENEPKGRQIFPPTFAIFFRLHYNK